MDHTSGMRSVSDSHKIQGQSLPEIRRLWKQCALDLDSNPEIREIARGALRDGNLLNAFVLYCCMQPEDVRLRIAKFGLAALEHLKDLDEPVDLTKMSVEAFGVILGNPDQGEDQSTRTRKGKSTSPDERKRQKRIG